MHSYVCGVRGAAKCAAAVRLSAFESFQDVNGVYTDFFDGIATFHDKQGRLAKTSDALAHLQVVRAVELELGNGIVLECIDTQRHYNHIWRIGGDAFTGLFQRVAPSDPATACR